MIEPWLLECWKAERLRWMRLVYLPLFLVPLDFIVAFWLDPYHPGVPFLFFVAVLAAAVLSAGAAVQVERINRRIRSAGAWHLAPMPRKVSYRIAVSRRTRNLVLVLMVLFPAGYVGSYVYLSRRAMAETRSFHGMAIWYRPPWSKQYSTEFHFACKIAYKPLNAIDCRFFRGMPADPHNPPKLSVDDLIKERD